MTTDVVRLQVDTSLVAYRWLAFASTLTHDGFSISKSWIWLRPPVRPFILKT